MISYWSTKPPSKLNHRYVCVEIFFNLPVSSNPSLVSRSHGEIPCRRSRQSHSRRRSRPAPRYGSHALPPPQLSSLSFRASLHHIHSRNDSLRKEWIFFKSHARYPIPHALHPMLLPLPRVLFRQTPHRSGDRRLQGNWIRRLLQMARKEGRPTLSCNLRGT